MTDLKARLDAARAAVEAADRAWEADLQDADARKAYKAAVKDFRAVEREALDANLQVTCGRCDGTGVIPWARHVANGVCFLCAGAKTVTVRKYRFDAAPDTRAKRLAKHKAAREAARAKLIEVAGEAVAKIEATADTRVWLDEDHTYVDGEVVGAARANYDLDGFINEAKRRIERFGDADKYLGFAAAKLAEVAATVGGEREKYRRMPARFGGKCVVCEQRIRKGDTIAYDGQAAHDECAVERYTRYGELLPLVELGIDARREERQREREAEEALREREADPEYRQAMRERRAMDAEYAAGIADGERYIAEKAIYGEELAEAFAMQDEHNRFWVHGIDD